MPDNQVLKFNLTESGLLCVLPWLTMAIFANIGGWIADTLVQRGISITNVRKVSSRCVFQFFLMNEFTRIFMLRTTDLEIIVHRVFVDHAIYWFPWTCLVLDAAEQSPNSSHGRVVHGM
jgi:hypothetical protein